MKFKKLSSSDPPVLTYAGVSRQIMETSRQLNESGILSSPPYGNISAKIVGKDAYVIDSDSILYERLPANKTALVSFDGKILKGKVRETTRGVFNLHASVYRKRPDVNAIIHTHSPHATAFAIVGKPIPCSTYELEWVNRGEVPVATFSRRGETELALGVIAAMGSGKAVLLANHGFIAVGENLDEAFTNALVVEDSAKKILLARELGEPLALPQK
jgi:L-fuculose-phosphate aldolase